MWEQTLLIILAGGLLSALLVVFALKFFFYRLLKKLAEACSQGNPVRIKVVPKTEEHAWAHESEVRKLCQDFEQQAGFRWVGDVAFTPIQGILGVLMVHPDGYGVVVYDHPRVGVWADVIASHQERGGLTVTSAPIGTELRRPPFSNKFYQTGASAAQLWELFQAKLSSFPSEKLFRLDRDNIVERCETAYADEIDWRNAQGGPSEQEVRSIAQNSPNPKATEEELAHTTEIQRLLAQSGLAEGLRQRFRDKMTPEQKLQFRSEDLVIIHDRLTKDELLEAIQAHIDEQEWEITDLPEACRDLPPRQAWQALQDLLPEVVRFDKVADLDFPLPTDAYKPPSGTLPIELFPHKRIQLEDPE